MSFKVIGKIENLAKEVQFRPPLERFGLLFSSLPRGRAKQIVPAFSNSYWDG